MISCSPALGGDTLSLAVDCAAFKDPGTNTAYLETYCGLYRHELTFIGSDTSQHLYAGVFLEATAVGPDGNAADSMRTYFLSQAKDTAQSRLTGVGLFDYLPLRLPPGQYGSG